MEKRYIGVVKDGNLGDIWEEQPNGNYKHVGTSWELEREKIEKDIKNGYLKPLEEKNYFYNSNQDGIYIGKPDYYQENLKIRQGVSYRKNEGRAIKI